MNDNDHTTLITICVLIGVVLTITVAIIGSVYNNNKNIDRDKAVIEHCAKVNTVPAAWGTGVNYNCGESK